MKEVENTIHAYCIFIVKEGTEQIIPSFILFKSSSEGSSEWSTMMVISRKSHGSTPRRFQLNTLFLLRLQRCFPWVKHSLLEQREGLGLLSFGQHSHIPEELQHPLQQEWLHLVLGHLKRTNTGFGQVNFLITVIKSKEIPGQARSKGIH